MTSIHHLAYRHPTVRAAIERAAEIVHSWRESERSGGDAAIAEHVQGWTAVALIEGIAWELLVRQGFDIEALCDALGECRDGEVSDVLGSFAEVRT